MLACVEVFKTSVLQLAPRSPTVRVRKVTFGNVIALLKVSHYKCGLDYFINVKQFPFNSIFFKESFP